VQVGGCRAWVGRRPTGLAWLGLAAVVVCRCPWNRDESEGVLLLLLLLLQYNSSIPSIPAVSHALWGVWWVEEGEGQWEGVDWAWERPGQAGASAPLGPAAHLFGPLFLEVCESPLASGKSLILWGAGGAAGLDTAFNGAA
jgi:hypothetical protein